MNTLTKTFLSELESEFHPIFVLPTAQNIAQYNMKQDNFVGWLIVMSNDSFDMYLLRRNHMNKTLNLVVRPDGQESNYDNDELFFYQNEALKGNAMVQQAALAKREKEQQRALIGADA